MVLMSLSQLVSAAALQCQVVHSACSDPLCTGQVGVRYGEALNPGPDMPLSFSVFSTNPSALRGKEAALLEHGLEVYLIAETQLSAVAQKSCRSQIRAFGQTGNQQWRT